jgi:hypothetical protein
VPQISSFFRKINCLSSPTEENPAALPTDGHAISTAVPREIPGPTRLRSSNGVIRHVMQSLTPDRSLDQKLADWVKECPLNETKTRKRVSAAIKKTLRTRAKRLSLHSLSLTSLPDCLSALTSLEELSLGRNHLKRLPPLPTSLKILSAEHNHLVNLPNLPLTLTELNVTDNELTSLPVFPDTLTTLVASQNFLTTIPPLTANIFIIKLNHNNLVDVPENLEEILQSHLGYMTAANNPWSDESLYELATMSRTIDILDMSFAPRIADHQVLPPESMYREPISAAAAKVLKLMKASTVTAFPQVTKPEGQLSSWEEIAIEDHAGAFALFLSDLSRTKSYDDSQSLEGRAEYVQRIDLLLETLQSSAILRSICFPIAVDACGNCHDRVSLTLNDMEMEILSYRIETGQMDTDELFEQLKGIFRLETINTIAVEHILRRRTGLTAADLEQADEAQMRLGYQAQLAGPLNLPVVTRSIHYPKCTNVTAEDIRLAHAKIAKCENSDQFIQFLARWKPWQTAMERQHPEVFQTMREDIASNRRPRSSFPIMMTENEYIDDLKNLAIYENETLKIKMAPLTRDFIFRKEGGHAE